jgi:aspartyl-tRNA(Asn)/glutamyl-tRNA(Gln) amidotransferase subunit C
MDVPYVAQLARLRLSPEEVEQFQSQLNQVLSYVEQLKQLNVEGIEPTAQAVPRTNVFRADDGTPSLPAEAALQNAPRKANDLFVVPKVVE